MKKIELSRKAVFVQKFKELTAGYKNQEVADMLDVSIDTVNKWRNDSVKTMPDTHGILNICEVFGCDPNYLFKEGEESFTPDHKEISRITGLSSKSISVLQHIQNTTGKIDNGMSFGPGKDNHSWKNVAMINDILEEVYDNMGDIKKNNRVIDSALAKMYDYTHTDYIEYTQNSTVLFTDQLTHAAYDLVDPVELLRTKILNDIQGWLRDHQHPYSKENYEPVSFDTGEEFQKWYQSKVKTATDKHDQ